MDNILIILTCTVHINPGKIFLHQTDASQRLMCYLKSIIQWLEKTPFRICVVENSGYTFPELANYIATYEKKSIELVLF